MVAVNLVRELDFPVSDVWPVLADYGNMEWAMGPPRVEVIGEGIGMIRRILMDGMEPIDEVLEVMDHKAMTYSYSIPRGLPLPLTDYRSTARVEAMENGKARVFWSCQCTPTDPSMTEAATEELMHSTYNALLDALEAFLGKRTGVKA
ncbi:MAG: SRPBCC family protein [Halieaceae bacterium]